MYSIAIGEVGINKDDFWKLTNGELTAIMVGHRINQDIESSNFRNLFTLLYNINRGKGRSAKDPVSLWPLAIDNRGMDMTMDERLELYKKIGQNGKDRRPVC